MAPNLPSPPTMASQGTVTTLSTPFNPAPSCTTSWTFEASQGLPPPSPSPSGFLLQNAFPSFDTSCFPGGFTGHGVYTKGPIYNPGVCPVGYFTASTIGTAQDITTAVCCPNNFVYLTTAVGALNKPKNTLAGCTSMYNGDATTVSNVIKKDNQFTLSSTVVSGSMTMWGQPITIQTSPSSLAISINPTPQGENTTPTDSVTSTSAPSSSILLQSTTLDLILGTQSSQASLKSTLLSSPSLPSLDPPVPSVATSTLSPSSPNAITPTHSITEAEKSHSKGLSAGDKAGISIAVLLAVALIVVAAFVFLRRRQTQNSQKSFKQSPSQDFLNSQPPPSQPNPTIPPVLATAEQTQQPRRNWKMPSRFPSRKAIAIATGSGGSRARNEMREAPVSPISPISSVSSRGYRVTNLEVKENRDVEPISPVSPVG